jgi:hypothetical protein
VGRAYVGWIHLAPYRVKWQAVAVIILVLETEERARKSLTSSVTVPASEGLRCMSGVFELIIFPTVHTMVLAVDDYECDLQIKRRSLNVGHEYRIKLSE